jgi:hypothetical protein
MHEAPQRREGEFGKVHDGFSCIAARPHHHVLTDQ